MLKSAKTMVKCIFLCLLMPELSLAQFGVDIGLRWNDLGDPKDLLNEFRDPELVRKKKAEEEEYDHMMKMRREYKMAALNRPWLEKKIKEQEAEMAE